MKILLDECLPVDFRRPFPTHEVHAVQCAGLKGLKNGELLAAAEAAGYEVLITVDQGIPRQSAHIERRLALLIVRSRTNQMEDLAPMAPAIAEALDSLQPGQIVVIPIGS